MCDVLQRRAADRPPGQHRARRRGRPRRRTASRSPPPTCRRCWRSASARTPGSRSSATSSAADRRAPSTATWAPCSGYAAVQQLLDSPDDEPQLIGIRGHRVDVVAADGLRRRDPIGRRRHRRRRLRRRRWRCAAAASPTRTELLRTIVQARPRQPEPGQRPLRLAVLHAGGAGAGHEHRRPRRACGSAMDRGHTVLGVRDGFRGLLDGDVEELDWMSVSGWVVAAGRRARDEPLRARRRATCRAIAGQLASHHVDGLLMIGGWAGYAAAHALSDATDDAGRPIPIVCVPASINNDLPGVRHEHRRRHRAQQHRDRRRQDQGVGGGARTAASSSR